MTFRGHFGRILIGTPGSFHVAAPSVAAARVTPGAGGRRRDRDVITQNRVYRARHTYISAKIFICFHRKTTGFTRLYLLN